MTPWNVARQASLSFTISWSLLKLMSIESMMPSNHLIFSHPLPFVLSIFPRIRVFSNESALRIRWPEYWSFSFSISPSSEYTGLIPFRIDWFDLLAVQGFLKSLLQHCSLKALILWGSAFFMVQLSHLYVTTGDLHLNSFSGASSHTGCYSGLFLSPRFLSFSVSFGIWKLIPSFYDSLVILCLYHSCLPGATKHGILDYAFSKIIFGYAGSSLRPPSKL